jgi:hypothetical protein
VFDLSEETLGEIALTTDRPFDGPIQEKDTHMHDLIRSSIEAHGGLDRWNQLRQISATFAPGCIGLKQRGQEALTQMATRVTLDTREQKTIFGPFLAPGQCGIFEPNRTAVETVDGTLLEELKNPRDSFNSLALGGLLGARPNWLISPVTRCGRTSPCHSLSHSLKRWN